MTAPSSEPGGSPSAEPSVDQLERDLSRLRAELAEYQGLIDELPQIYEEKFRGQVQELVQDIRRLMDERQALQEQVSHALSPADAPAPALAPGASVEPPPPPPAKPSQSRWRRPSLEPVRQRWQQARAVLASRWRGQGRWFALAFALAVAGSTLALLRSRTAPSPAPLPPARSGTGTLPGNQAASTPSPVAKAPPDLDLRLRATGESWVEVRTLEGEVVYVNTLQEGNETTIRLGEGLRIRSGRPDLLTVGVGEQPLRVLGPVDAITWHTVLPGKTEPLSSTESSNRGL